MKTCRICHQTLPLSAFNRKADNRDGLQTACRECDRAKAKARQEANKERAYAYQAAWRDANRNQWNGWMAAAYKKRQSAQLQRVPSWFDQDKVREIYELASEFREAGFKVDVDVDHIIPLQGEIASGLPGQPQPKQAQRDARLPRAFSNTRTAVRLTYDNRSRTCRAAATD